MKYRILIFLLLSGVAQARLYNYQDVPLGDRAFGMGGVAMAMSDNVGSMFYNPALMALGATDQISASLSTYTRFDTRTGEYVSLFASARDNVTRGGFASIPSMVAGKFRYKQFHWGGGVFIPDFFENSGTQIIDANNVAVYSAKEDSLWGCLFGAYEINPEHRIGIAIFYTSWESSERFLFSNNASGQTQIRFVEQGYDSNGLAVLIGGAWEINPDLRLGYSIRPPIIHFGGKGTYIDQRSGDKQISATTFDTEIYPIPMRLSVGLSWQPLPTLTLGLDAHVYSALRTSISSVPIPIFNMDTKEIVNLGIGGEYMFSQRWGMRMGFFSNNSSIRNTPKGLSSLVDRVHMFGATAALVVSKETGTISLGGYLQAGEGRSSPIGNENADVFIPRSNYFYGAVVGSSYRF